MNKRIDELGRLCIPKAMRNELGINDNDLVNIECKDNKIIISNAKEIRSREEIKNFLERLKANDDDLSKGMKTALEWCLKEDTK
jgi:AbrB family looped-hinge helix DNA binding protein